MKEGLNTRDTPEVIGSIFFWHFGNTDMMKFCTCPQDSYNGLYKRFSVNSTVFMF